MPEQKNTNVSISNQPIDPNWKPPAGGQFDPNWKIPVQTINPDEQQQQNLEDQRKDLERPALQRAVEWGSKPVVDVMSPFVRQVTEAAKHAQPNDTYAQAYTRSAAANIIGDLANFVNWQATPFGMGLEALTGGASVAQNLANRATNAGDLINAARYGKIASKLQKPGQLAGAGMVGHGLYNAYTQPDWADKAGALAEAAMGGIGAAHLMKGTKAANTDLLTGKLLEKVKPLVEEPPKINIEQKTPPIIVRPPAYVTPEGSQVKKPVITDYWINDPQTGKKKLNPKYQVSGLTMSEPEVEKLSKNKKKPYFVQDETGKWVPNPEHPNLKGQEPEQARALGGKGLKVGSDVSSAIGELTTGYSKPVHEIMVREGMQNAIDAVKPLGKNGKIAIHITPRGEPNPAITITDNGPGMDRHQLQTLMSDLNRSGKKNDPNATGGKGVGKATYMFGGTHFKLVTVKQMRGQKIMFTFEGTPQQIEKGVKISYKVVPDSVPTGTSFTTKLDPTQDVTLSRDRLRQIMLYSRDLEAKVNVDIGPADVKGDREFKKSADDKVIGQENFNGNGVKVIIPKNSPVSNRHGVTMHVLNNGIHQYDKYIYAGDKTIPLPGDVIIDITPSSKEGTNEYPFPTQRESLKEEISKKVDDFVKETLIDPQKAAHQTKLKELYDAMYPLGNPNAKRPVVVYDPGERMTPEEVEIFKKSHTLKQLTTLLDGVVDNAIESTGEKNWRDRLEKTGLVLDPGSHGIHIPHPDSGHSMIGFNPFLRFENSSPYTAALEGTVTALHEVGHIGIEKGSGKVSFSEWAHEPRLGEYLDNYFEQQRVHGNLNTGHAIGWLTRLGDIYAAYGPEKFFDAVGKYQGIISDGSGNYTPEVQKLLQIYKDSRGRTATTEDFLSRTGEQSESTGGRKEPISSNDKANAERPAPKPEIVDKLIEALKNAGAKRATQEDMYSVERATRIAAAQKADTGGLTGFYKQLRELKGEMPKVDFERTRLTPGDRDDLLNAVGSSPYLLPYEKIRAKMGLLKMLSAKREEVPQFNELKLLKQVFGDKFNQVVEMHGGLGVKPNMAVVKDLANLPKAVMASIDMSAPLRQGLPLIHKEAWRNNLGPMVKMFASKDVFDANMQAIKDDPAYLLAKEAGLKLTGTHDEPITTKGKLNLTNIDPENKEEAYGSALANMIPGIPASERAYVGFLSKLRFDTFKSLLKDAELAGLHRKDVMHEVANFVNTATGRGQLPGKMDAISHGLNTAFFSPRLIASRIQMMNPATYVKASPFVRMEFLKAAAATASAGLTTTALMSAMGAKTATKLSDSKGSPLLPIPGFHGFPGMPISADFGKSRFGNSREENYGGFLPYVTYMGRMLSGERESSTTGKTYILGKGFATPNRLNITEDFIANKLSPVASLAYKILKQKDPTGKEYQFSPTMMQSLIDISNGNFESAMKNAKSGEVGDMFIPMFIGDLISVMKDDPEHWPMTAGSFFGMGMQTYGKTPPKPRGSGIGNIGIGAGMPK